MDYDEFKELVKDVPSDTLEETIQGTHQSKTEMRIITAKIPAHYLEAVDILTEGKLYPSRSELIRVAMREYLIEKIQKIRVFLGLAFKDALPTGEDFFKHYGIEEPRDEAEADRIREDHAEPLTNRDP
jgi:Arc/MetJ-type ribon-helix-helix transcriptional regulator